MHLRSIAWLVLSAGLSCGALAQEFPTKALRLIVPFGSGNATDIVARIITPKMSERLGQQVIVENRPGASAIIGTTAVMQSAPDGYTLRMTNIGFGANPVLYGEKLPFDPVKNFSHISLIVTV